MVNARSIAGYQPSECQPHPLGATLKQSHGRQRSSSTEVIEIPDAALGASPDAPTLEGPVTVKIPAGTQSGAAPRLRGKGLPEFGPGKYGDLFLRLQANVPEKLSAEERKLYGQLRALKQKRQTAE